MKLFFLKAMAEINLEKIIGTPIIGNIKYGKDLSVKLVNAILYSNTSKTPIKNDTSFIIKYDDSKNMSKVSSACTLKKNIEIYGTYDSKNNQIIVSSFKVIY